MWPAAWAYEATGTPDGIWTNDENISVQFANYETDAVLNFVNDISSIYNLKTFNGNGSGTGSFTIKLLEEQDGYYTETGENITVQYSKEGDTITLTSADIEAWESGMAFTKGE